MDVHYLIESHLHGSGIVVKQNHTVVSTTVAFAIIEDASGGIYNRVYVCLAELLSGLL